MRKTVICLLTACMLCLATIPAALQGSSAPPVSITSRSAVLMEANTGEVLMAKNEDEALQPASVTKLMAMLLIMEEIDAGKIKLTDNVTASPEASRQGGSQIWLEPGEVMTVGDLMKAISIVSANDAVVDMGEYLAGSEENFVRLMNERAKELGMKNTVYVNPTGLTPDDPSKGVNMTTAMDQAILAREVLRHPGVLQWTGTWIDYIRDGESFLRNTNRLVRFYEGCDGLKTGFTDEAGYCLVATAKKAGVRLIAVIMKSPTSTVRDSEITKLFNYGFSQLKAYQLYQGGEEVAKLPVHLGKADELSVVVAREMSVVVKREVSVEPEKKITLPSMVTAPIKQGAVLGYVSVTIDGKECGRVDLIAADTVERSGFWQTLIKVLAGTLSSFFRRD